MKIPRTFPGCLFSISFLLLSSCGSFVKDTDGNKYSTVKIGNQQWMTENLNASHFRNGDPINEVKDNKAWESAGREGEAAWCYFDNNTENGIKYGKIYNWYAVSDPRGLAPEGWHIPEGEEWALLIRNLGGEKVAGDRMKSGSGWNNDCNGNNKSGFSGLPGGYRHYSGVFNRYDASGGAYWWGSAEGFVYIACSYPLYHSIGGNERFFTSKARGFSIRCIRD